MLACQTAQFSIIRSRHLGSGQVGISGAKQVGIHRVYRRRVSYMPVGVKHPSCLLAGPGCLSSYSSQGGVPVDGHLVQC